MREDSIMALVSFSSAGPSLYLFHRVDGGITFISFIIFGVVPLLGYLIFYSVPGLGTQELFVIACCLTAVTLFLLGALKTKVTAQKWYLGPFLSLHVSTHRQPCLVCMR